jgi:hypothetical protein
MLVDFVVEGFAQGDRVDGVILDRTAFGLI